MIARIGLLALLGCTACGPRLYSDGHIEATNRWLEHFAHYPAQRALRGEASYYHDSLAGNHTANGDIYDPNMLTAAHRTLPFGTIARVTRLDTGARVVVRVNDRGPFGKRTRIIDLSREAAIRLQMLHRGVAQVQVDILHRAP